MLTACLILLPPPERRPPYPPILLFILMAYSCKGMGVGPQRLSVCLSVSHAVWLWSSPLSLSFHAALCMWTCESCLLCSLCPPNNNPFPTSNALPVTFSHSVRLGLALVTSVINDSSVWPEDSRGGEKEGRDGAPYMSPNVTGDHTKGSYSKKPTVIYLVWQVSLSWQYAVCWSQCVQVPMSN